ncbi:MAG: response regulator [Archangiaceae bacterium]|nr:response regulator [Archangiaceae bacterium]
MSITPLVLISDDDTVLANAMVRAARHAGLRAFSDTSSRAPDLAARYRPDVVVMDVRQLIDGRELLAEMKRDARTRDIRVVMASGIHDDAVRDSCLAAGAEEFVPKPFPPSFFRRLALQVKEKETETGAFEVEEAPAPHVVQALKKPRVLVVGLPNVGAEVLGPYDVERVATAEEAFEALKRERFVVVLTEQPVEGPGGVELVLRARELMKATRGVVLADASQYFKAARLDPGCGCQMLLRPCKVEQIAEAVARAARVATGRLGPL